MTPAALTREFGVSRETCERLEAYIALLTRWNARINLVSPATIETVWSRHVADSAQLFDLAPASASSWIDLGSGAGFPGLVVAALAADKQPGRHVTLVESDTRKAAFLTTAAREMDVDVTIGELDESNRFAAFEPVPTGPEERIEVLGLALASMTPELRERFGIGADVGGVVVTERLDGESDDPELRPGDVIVSVAKKEVETPAEVSATIELLRGEGARTVLVLRYREGSEHFVTVDIAPS